MKKFEQHFNFNYREFNDDGFNMRNGLFFMDFVKSCERAFYEKNLPFHANFLFGNDTTMIMVKNCMEREPETDYGMDLINGEIDLDTNLEVETYCKRSTVYGIGSESDDDEPLFLIRDNDELDGRIVLKYVPDNDDEGGDEFSPKSTVLSFTPSMN